VLYISCSPETLSQNLATLSKTHSIQSLAFFDQFPYTPHLESGVILTRR
jgi:tRNA (uracil-5-)-methyltransferase